MERNDVPPVSSIEETYWTQSRRELAGWFQRNAPSLGELYEGALKMISKSNFPGRTRFVAHAVREIRNRLPDVIAGRKAGSDVQYKNRLDDIAKDWQKAGFPVDETMPLNVTTTEEVALADVPIPTALFKKITVLVKDHLDGRESRKEAAIRLFEGIAPENQNLRDTLRPVVGQWLDVTEWFMKKAHDPGDLESDVDSKELLSQFELFETSLGALVRGFFKTVKELDEILEDTNF